MGNFDIPEYLFDKIYEIKSEKNTITKIVSYFPFSDMQKNQIRQSLGNDFTSGTFHSIFSDSITDEEWEKSKIQIKKRFQDELFDIDQL